MELSVIIPIFNEEEGISYLHEELSTFFEKADFKNVEVIFVNDGSSDRTFKKLCMLNPTSYNAKVISLSRNFGSHAALRAGIMQSKGEWVTFMYADLQDPLSLITTMYHNCMKGHEITWAHREASENSRIDRTFSRLYATLMKKFAVSNFPERGFDVVMFSRKIATEINRNVENNSSIFLQILTLGFFQSHVSYQKKKREIGKSKWTLSKKIKLLIDSFVAFSYMPIRLVSITGVTFFILGLIWAGYLIARKILFNDLESGWPALFSTLLLGFGITNISLGIIAEYLWRTLDASRKRPVFIIDKIIELNK